jgi:hypothetical protein
VAHGEGPEQLGLAHRRVVPDDIRERLLRVEVQERRDAAELEREIDEDDAIRALRDRAIAMFVAIVVVPTPPLGLYTATVRRGSRHRETVGRDHRGEALRALEPEQQGLDPRLELRVLDRPGDDIVRAGLEERDALLDVLAVATHITGTEASAGAARRSRQTSTADFGPPVRSMMTSWWSAAFANASSGDAVRVTV